MKNDISNKTLAILFIFAIFVFIINIITINNIHSIKEFTGHQVSDFGYVGLNITSEMRIELVNNNLNFGIGYINRSYTGNFSECNLSTYDKTIPTCWLNLTPYPSVNLTHLSLENIGDLPVNVTINSSNATDFFLGGITGGTPRFIWRGIRTPSDDGCLGSNLTETYNGFNNSEQNLCGYFIAKDESNMLNISINLSVPHGPLGYRAAPVVFTATSVY